MNSYFEQSAGGFYGSHHHQTSAAAQHHDPASAAAAYRSFPLGLGMSPYASSQHHHHSSSGLGIHPSGGTNTRPPQDSPYDASVATACKLYSSTPDSATAGHTTSSYTSSSKDCKQQEQAVAAAAAAAHQNGYAAAMAAAAVKDVWQSASAVASAAGQGTNSSVVRPSACTPEGSRVSGTGGGGAGGGSYSGLDAASSPGNNGSSRSLTSSWNTCSLNSSAASQPVATQLHQQPSNHTFYPWMAIAGLSVFAFSFLFCSFVHRIIISVECDAVRRLSLCSASTCAFRVGTTCYSERWLLSLLLF